MAKQMTDLLAILLRARGCHRLRRRAVNPLQRRHERLSVGCCRRSGPCQTADGGTYVPVCALMMRGVQDPSPEPLAKCWLRQQRFEATSGNTSHRRRMTTGHGQAAAGRNRHHWGAGLEDSGATVARPVSGRRPSDAQLRRIGHEGRPQMSMYSSYSDQYTVGGPL